MTKTDAPDPATVGGNVTYTITVRNSGQNPAENVVITDPLPAEVTYVSATPSKGTCAVGPPLSCTLGTLAPGETVTIDVVVTANQRGQVTNEVTVTTTTQETTTTNNRATTTTTVQGPFVPPVACSRMTVAPRGLTVGKRSTLTGPRGRQQRSRHESRPRHRPRSRRHDIRGRTNAQGVVKLAVRPTRTGIVQIRVTGRARARPGSA